MAGTTSRLNAWPPSTSSPAPSHIVVDDVVGVACSARAAAGCIRILYAEQHGKHILIVRDGNAAYKAGPAQRPATPSGRQRLPRQGRARAHALTAYLRRGKCASFFFCFSVFCPFSCCRARVSPTRRHTRPGRMHAPLSSGGGWRACASRGGRAGGTSCPCRTRAGSGAASGS
jgi:hypothetical protein